MAEKELKSRLVQKHDIQANWEKAVSFIPKQGEIIVYDKDESFDYVRVKIGDGQTPVNDLAFAVANIADIPTKTSELTNDSGFINLANQQVKMPSSQDWQSVTYGNNKFVAIAGSSNTAAYSEDGINWVATTMPSSQPQDSATYGNGKFVAIAYGSNIAAYSEDGINWTETTMPSSKNWKSVTYGNGKFVAVAVNSDIAAYSIDGISWIAITMPSSREWWSVTYGNGKFVAVVYGSKIAAYSEDGITWTETTMPSSTNWRSVTYGNDKFVAVAASSSTAAYSEDGIIWTKTMRFNSARWFSVTYGNGKFVVVAYDSDIAAYSEDGINWTETTLPISQDWFSVTYGNGKFVAVGLDSDIVAYSIDGINWKIEFTVLFQNDVDITDDIIPTKTSELTNDSGFITAADIPEVPEAPVKSVNGKTGEVVLTPNDIGAQPAGNYLTAVPVGYATETYVNNKVSEIDVPTKTSELTNDSGFITASNIPEIPTKTSDLTNDSGFITASDIPEVPTKLSELENDLYFNNTFTLSLTEQDFAVDATLKKLAYIGSPAFGLAAFDKDEIDVVYTFNMTTADGTITAYDNITYPRAVEKLAIGDGYYIRTYFGQPMAMKPQFMFRDGVDVNGNLNNTFIIQEASTITSPIKNLVSNGGTFTLDVTFIIKKEIPENVLPLICSQDTIKLLITTINAHSNITDNKGNYWDENTLELARMFNVVFDNGYNKGSKYIYYYENGVKTEAGLVRFSNGEFRYFLSDGSMCYGRTYYPTVTNGLLPSVALVFGEDGVITNSIYTMTQNLTNITSDYDCQYIPNTTTSITINLTANTNYTISSVEITMDGSDKSSWYSNGVITIPASSVTGDVVITAVAS